MAGRGLKQHTAIDGTKRICHMVQQAPKHSIVPTRVPRQRRAVLLPLPRLLVVNPDLHSASGTRMVT